MKKIKMKWWENQRSGYTSSVIASNPFGDIRLIMISKCSTRHLHSSEYNACLTFVVDSASAICTGISDYAKYEVMQPGGWVAVLMFIPQNAPQLLAVVTIITTEYGVELSVICGMKSQTIPAAMTLLQSTCTGSRLGYAGILVCISQRWALYLRPALTLIYLKSVRYARGHYWSMGYTVRPWEKLSQADIEEVERLTFYSNTTCGETKSSDMNTAHSIYNHNMWSKDNLYPMYMDRARLLEVLKIRCTRKLGLGKLMSNIHFPIE
jgi:hypothetical protein